MKETEGRAVNGENMRNIPSIQSQKRKRASPSPEVESEEDGDDWYEIDYIADSRIIRRKGRQILQYLIHWAGYAVHERTWEDEDGIGGENCSLVQEFYQKNPGKPRLLPPPVRKEVKLARKVEVVITTRRIDGKSSATYSTGQPSPHRSSITSPQANSIGEEDPNSFPTRRPVRSTVSKTAKRSSLRKLHPNKKRKTSSDDESDFVFEGGEWDEDDDGDVHFRSDEDSEQERSAEEPESDEEIIKSAKKARTSLPKAKLRPKPANLGSFVTGVRPLGQELDIKAAVRNMSEDLPPISDIEAMFDHLVSRIPDIIELVRRLNGRKLRVATMCS